MERLQAPLNSCFFGEHFEVNCLDQALFDSESLRLEEEAQLLISSLDDNMPFLQMLQSVEMDPLKEPSFQTLLRLQHMKKPREGIAYIPRMESYFQTSLELESCVTNESTDFHNQHTFPASRVEKAIYECNQEPEGKTAKSCPKPQPVITTPREKRKRKRTRPTKNKEDVENQRMTHIAVERNRRRQMNDHLSVLRSLMPPSYIQRGDQASVIGGAIDFVKELEQLLQSLEAQKMIRKNNEEVGSSSTKPSSSSTTTTSLGYGMRSSTSTEEDEVKAENKSETADIKVTLIQSHVNLKIECQRRAGQLIKVIVALEELRLTILHLNITSSETSVLYSLNLKIEEDCKLGSADDIIEAVHNIFRYIDGG